MMIHFVVPGEPKGKGRPRFNTRTGRAYTPDSTASYENLVRWSYINEYEGFKYDDTCQLLMVINAFYGIPKSDSKKKREQKLSQNIRPTKKPDMDNVVKIIADSLNGIAYKDDTQIVSCIVRKWYADDPRVEVIIEDLT